MKTYRSTKKQKKNIKKAVSEVRGQAYEEMYRKLDTKEGENDVYKMAKIRERKIREFNQVKYINDETNKILVNDDDIKNKLIEYFDKLFNEESEQTAIELDNSFDDTNRWFVRRIQESDVKEALKMMKIDKALGHDDIPIEVWRCLEDATIV
jgi:hypothetical protein